MSHKEVFETLCLLTPYDIPNRRKIRVGSSNDGGYIMLDCFTPGQKVFSYGLSWNIAYELDFAKRGQTVFMFDHTIDALSVDHPNFRWAKEGIAANAVPELLLSTLADHVARYAPDGRDMILKLDVEGAEWETLAAMPDDLLGHFEQIVIELHDLHLLADAPWRKRAKDALAKLADQFTLHHAHANNHAPLIVVDNAFTVASVLEVSYVRTASVERRKTSTLFPTYLDAPNDPNRPDAPLWLFFSISSHARGRNHRIFRRSYPFHRPGTRHRAARRISILMQQCHERDKSWSPPRTQFYIC
jgi:hypothetical protein